MKRWAAIASVLFAIATPLFASYIVVLKDGTQYKAKQRWNVLNGKAIIVLEEGGMLQVDPSLIDTKRTDEVNKLGLGNVKVLAVESPASGGQGRETSTLGQTIRKLRKPEAQPAAQSPAAGSAPPQSSAPPPVAAGSAPLGADVISKFEAAYDNVGIFEHRVTSPGGGRLVVNLTADDEDDVFGAITATAFFMTGVPKSTGQAIALVELYMQTTNGAAAGRFHMAPEDAEALNSKRITPSAYFVSKVLY